MRAVKSLPHWSGHTGTIDALAVSSDGKVVLSSANDESAKLWDMNTRRELNRFGGQKEFDLHAIFTPDGRRAIITSTWNLIRVYDVATGNELFHCRGHKQKVDSLATSPDGKVLASGSWPERMLRFWDLSDGHSLGQIELDANPQLGTFTPDGRRVVWTFSDHTVREFAVPEPAVVALQPGHSRPGEPLVISAGGQINDLAVGGAGRYLILLLKEKREIAVFDANQASIVKRIPLASSDALFAAGAKTLVVAYPEQRLLERWDLRTMARWGKRTPSPIRARLFALAMGSDSDGPILAVWSPDPAATFPRVEFSFLDLGTFHALRAESISLKGSFASGSLSPSGGSAMLQGAQLQRTRVRAASTGDLFTTWCTGSQPSGFSAMTIRRGSLNLAYQHEHFGYLARVRTG